MTRIFFVIDTLSTGGSERSLLDIISRFSPDIEPVVVTLYKGDTLAPLFEQAGIRLVRFNLGGKYEFKKAYGLFKALCLQEKPDLVVASLFRSEVVARLVCRKLRIPLVGTFVNDTYSSHEFNNVSFTMKLKLLFFWGVNFATARLCRYYLSNSEAIKESNARALGVPRDAISVIYRGRDISAFDSPTAPRFASDKIRLLNVGRLIRRKGQIEMVQAFAQVKKQYPQAELLVAGDGKLKSELQQEIARLGVQDSVTLLGNVKNVQALLNTCDVFVFPSHYEGFSGALVEAMLSGIPIVASDISMNREALQGEQHATFFKVKDAHSLAQAMQGVLTNPREAIAKGEAARAFARLQYDINSISRQHEAYYKKVLAKEV